MAKTDALDLEVGATDLARLLGISERRIRELRDRGTIPDNGRGRYVLGIAVPAYSEHIRALGAGWKGEGEGGEVLDLTAERARKAKEEADRLEMQNAVMRGELLARSDVDAAVIEDYSRVRAKLLGIPSKVAPLVAATSEPREAEGLVKRAINEALQELSDPEALFDAGAGLADGSEAAADLDSEPVGGSRKEA